MKDPKEKKIRQTYSLTQEIIDIVAKEGKKDKSNSSAAARKLILKGANKKQS